MKRSLLAKISAFAVAIVMALSMTACAFTDAITAYGLYAKAAKTIKEAGGVETDTVMTISMNILGGDISQAVNMNTKQNGKDNQTITTVNGVSTVTTTIGDYIYIESNGKGTKYHVTKESSENDDGEEEKALPELSKDIFEGIEVDKTEDGRRSITITVDESTAAEIMAEKMGETEGTDVSISGMVISFFFDKNGNLETMSISCDMSITVLGMSIPAKVNADMTFVNLGTAPEIALGLAEEEYEDGGEYTGDSGSYMDMF